MQLLPNSPVRIQFGLRGWAAIAVGIAILAAVSFLAIDFLVLILPVVLLGSILLWFLPKATLYRVDAPSEKPPANDAATIEGDLQVIEGACNENLKPPGTPGK